ncbi:ABC transporter substrate-binding protein [Gluconacetobacter azotocaptans]|uniref:ABC transporter substrate-binding protein n=1 Tax=Gluconacetobacter azotocaptans TaxID=142834 RepID=UPI0019570A88|nr:ABC transporter substrate-binding protein [Gluconacetobacter azotocaptans]MBM9401451.1 ABC transporter substrate-binding protein [Gluconacetobacter azotocaptans]
MARSPGVGNTASLTRRGLVRGLLAGGTLAAAGPALAAPVPLRVGDQKGGARSLLAAAGQDHVPDYPLQWSLFAGAPMLIQALAADAIDTGVIGDAPLVFAQGGADTIRAVAGIQTDGTMTAIVVRHDSPIRSVRDLKGRSVATLRAQTGHYLALAALREAGLHDDDVHFVFIPPVSAKLALQTGAVDAWATWGPYISDAKVADGAREIVNGGRLMSGLSYVVATESALRTRRDAVADYVRRLRAGHDWMHTHLDEYAAVWAADVGLPLAVAKDVVRATQGTVVPLGPDVVRKQQAVSDFMFDTRMIPRRLAATAVMDTRFTF